MPASRGPQSPAEEKVPAGKAGSRPAAGAHAGRETWSLPAALQALKPDKNLMKTLQKPYENLTSPRRESNGFAAAA